MVTCATLPDTIQVECDGIVEQLWGGDFCGACKLSVSELGVHDTAALNTVFAIHVLCGLELLKGIGGVARVNY